MTPPITHRETPTYVSSYPLAGLKHQTRVNFTYRYAICSVGEMFSPGAGPIRLRAISLNLVSSRRFWNFIWPTVEN
jgi:hypothetical protein